MTIRERLVAGRARIASVETWTRREFARDANDRPVDPASPEAVRWCAIGALRADGYLGDDTRVEAIWRLDKAARFRYDRSMADVNDLMLHAAVLRVYDDAIRRRS